MPFIVANGLFLPARVLVILHESSSSSCHTTAAETFSAISTGGENWLVISG